MSDEVALKLEQETPQEVLHTEDNALAFFRKMAKMRLEISGGELPVDGWNENQKYEYTSAKHYKKLLNDACLNNGMEYYPQLLEVTTLNLPNADSKQHLTRVRANIVLIDLDTGFSVAFPTFADGCDSLDKGIYKAETMMIKAFVQNTFLRHDKDEIDPEASVKRGNSPGFVSPVERQQKMKTTVANSEVASEQMIDRIYDAVVKIRSEVDPDYLQGGELDKFNDGTMTDVEANILMLKIEEFADENGVEL